MTIQPGDRVGYRVRFLRAIGMCHSDMAAARGTVKDIIDLGQTKMAVVLWDPGCGMPSKVLVVNLAKPGTMAFTSEDR